MVPKWPVSDTGNAVLDFCCYNMELVIGLTVSQQICISSCDSTAQWQHYLDFKFVKYLSYRERFLWKLKTWPLSLCHAMWCGSAVCLWEELPSSIPSVVKRTLARSDTHRLSRNLLCSLGSYVAFLQAGWHDALYMVPFHTWLALVVISLCFSVVHSLVVLWLITKIYVWRALQILWLIQTAEWSNWLRLVVISFTVVFEIRIIKGTHA